jgi:hypothetical protein
VLSDRRPGSFKAGPGDADVVRTAIALRVARPGVGCPDERFVAQLRQELARELQGPEPTPARSGVARRARLMVGAVAAVTMLGGTVVATTTANHALAARTAPAGYGQILRTGTFTSAGGHAVGEIVAYRGNPSWVFMSIRVPGVTGSLRCQIEMDDGHTTATGTFVIHNGVGEWARPVSLDIDRFRGATLVNSGGTALATASFRSI